MRPFQLFLCLSALLFTACAPATPAAVPPVTPTRPPSATPRPSPTSSPVPSPTPPGPVRLQRKIPAWLKDPKAPSILMFSPGQSENGADIAFINAPTGQKFTLSVKDLRGYFWLDGGQAAGFLTSQPGWIRLDLQTGREERFQFADDFSFTATSSPTPLIASGTPGEAGFRLVPQSSAYSYDRHYFIDEAPDPQHPGWRLNVLNKPNIFPVTDRSAGVYDYEYAWSPVNYRLAVLQSQQPPQSDNFAGELLRVYAADQKMFLASYKGQFDEIQWSPNGREILYQVPVRLDSERSSNIPCVLDLAGGDSLCYYAIYTAAKAMPKSHFRWLPDGSGIAFLMTDLNNPAERGSAYLGTDLNNPAGHWLGHVCVYRFQTDRADCPTLSLKALAPQDPASPAGLAVIDYTLSPDGRFLLFDFDQSTAWSAAPVRPYTALVALDGSHFLALWDETAYQKYGERPFSAASGVLWRPLNP